MKAYTKHANLFCHSRFLLDSGESLSPVTLSYQTYGELSPDGDNVVLICHALTGNAHAAGIITEEELNNPENNEYLTAYNKMTLGKPGWWDALIGPDKLFDTNKYFVVCSNILGSCYGSTGPASMHKSAPNPPGPDFPAISVRDVVRLQKKMLDQLGVKHIKVAAGGSLGGMQVLEWAIQYSEMIDLAIPIATSAAHSPWAIGLNDAQRSAIKADANFKNGYYSKQPVKGLSAARKIAMLSYRTSQSFGKKFARERQENSSNQFAMESYLEYQGEKLVKRFDANSYITISKMLDSHDVGVGRGSVKNALGSIKSRTVCIGIDTDILYPPSEQKEIASQIPNSEYHEISSIYGHDAFLLEFDQLETIIKPYLS